jgi:hypothetical protein
MRQQHTLEILSGPHEGSTAGVNLVSSWDFTTAGVQVGDAVINHTLGTSGTVQSLVNDNTLETDINFQPGDFFEVTLSTAWSVASNLGPVYELICKMCGKSCKSEELDSYDGRCKKCYDEPRKTAE